MFRVGVAAFGAGPRERRVFGCVGEDYEQVTPREPWVGEPSEAFPVADQFVLDFGAVLVDQVDERKDSPTVVSIMSRRSFTRA